MLIVVVGLPKLPAGFCLPYVQPDSSTDSRFLMHSRMLISGVVLLAVAVPLRAAEQSTKAPVPATQKVDFGTQVEPLLTRFGCNAGGCHGKASGQNGFKLSLFGFDTSFDYEAIVEEARG